jgi:hypothetical protein
MGIANGMLLSYFTSIQSIRFTQHNIQHTGCAKLLSYFPNSNQNEDNKLLLPFPVLPTQT